MNLRPQASTEVIARVEPRDGLQGVNAVQRDGFPAEGTISIGAQALNVVAASE